MKLTNVTDWDDDFLRAMTLWVCETVECPKRAVKTIQFGNRSGRAWSGRAWPWKGRVLVRVIDHGVEQVQTKTRFGITVAMHNRLEILILVTAHEITHIRQHDKTLEFSSKQRYKERECDKWERIALDKFRENREALLMEWNAAKRPSKAKPKLPAAEKREANVRKLLGKWEAKKKRAASAVKKYKAKVAYYDRRNLSVAKGEPCNTKSKSK